MLDNKSAQGGSASGRKRVEDIPYMNILKNAFQFTWKNKFLWWFGFFIALSSPGSFNMNFPSGTNDISNSKAKEVFGSFSDFWHQYLIWIIIGIFVLFVIFIALYALGKIARGALIKSVEKIDTDKPSGFKLGWIDGKKYFWKILGLDILLNLSITILVLIVIAPSIILFFYKAYLSGVLLILLALIFIFTLSILVSFLNNYGRFYIVLGNLSIWNAIEKAYALFKKNISTSLIMFLINFALSTAAGLSFLIVFFILILIAILGGLAIYAAFQWIGVIIFSAIILLLFIAVIFLFRSIIEVFFQTVWFLFFKEIATQPKAQEAIAEPVLETKLETKPSESINMHEN